MKVKVGSVILGFVMICIGIAALAGQTPVFGIHPIVWFILGVMLICSDSAWEKLAHGKRHERKEGRAGNDDGKGDAAYVSAAPGNEEDDMATPNDTPSEGTSSSEAPHTSHTA